MKRGFLLKSPKQQQNVRVISPPSTLELADFGTPLHALETFVEAPLPEVGVNEDRLLCFMWPRQCMYRADKTLVLEHKTNTDLRVRVREVKCYHNVRDVGDHVHHVAVAWKRKYAVGRLSPLYKELCAQFDGRGWCSGCVLHMCELSLVPPYSAEYRVVMLLYRRRRVEHTGWLGRLPREVVDMIVMHLMGPVLPLLTFDSKCPGLENGPVPNNEDANLEDALMRLRQWFDRAEVFRNED